MCNAYCDGSHCTDANAETRKLPSGDKTMVFCKTCYDREMNWRESRNAELGRVQAGGHGFRWELPAWDTLTVYEPAREDL